MFVSRHLLKTGHPAAFTPLDHMVEDDELVCAPSLCFTEVKGQRSLVFEGLVQQLCSQFFPDCGATHTFVSLDFARANHLTIELVKQTSATLADGNGVSIHGVLKSLDVKFGAFRTKQDFLVVDIPQYDAVLGMDLLVRHYPLLSFQKRTMTFAFDTRGVIARLHCKRSSPTCVPTMSSIRTRLSCARLMHCRRLLGVTCPICICRMHLLLALHPRSRAQAKTVTQHVSAGD